MSSCPVISDKNMFTLFYDVRLSACLAFYFFKITLKITGTWDTADLDIRLYFVNACQKHKAAE